MPFFLALVLALLTACSSGNEKKPVTIFSDNIMTIDYKIIIGNRLSLEQKKQLYQTISATFDEINAIYNKWNPDSELSHLNRLPAGKPSPISEKLENFLRLTGDVVKQTEGRFDPTIEPIQHLWNERLAKGSVPSEDEIQALAPAVGWDKVHFGEGKFWKDHENTALDLGGIAKGYCVDLLVERINAAGFPDVCVEWGGEIRSSGQHPDKRPWTIFISRLGDADPKNSIAIIGLVDQAIATSGDYLQFWTVKGPDNETVTYFHIIHPRTLHPLVSTPSSVASASVLAPTCTMADGLATAAMMFDSVEKATAWAESIQQKIPNTHFWLVARKEAKFSAQ